ncbi:hypothetical protein F4825DRAFT_431636 [Nemania diffusa]|nr:hypothetical protein F4825DRAFT_431636 [Nemania diffusa]
MPLSKGKLVAPQRPNSTAAATFSGHAIGVDVVFLHDLGQPHRSTWESDIKLWLLKYLLADATVNLDFFFYDYGPFSTSDWEAKAQNRLNSLETIVSASNLEEYAAEFLACIKTQWPGDSNEPLIFFIAHGYGGLILQQALVSLKNEDNGFLSQTKGIIFLGTPHMRAGLAEWALLSAIKLGVPCQKTVQQQDWSGYTKDIDQIANMQQEFCHTPKNRNPLGYAEGIDIACCYYNTEELPRRDHVRANACCFFLACLRTRMKKPANSIILGITSEWAAIPHGRMVPFADDHFNTTSLYTAETEAIKTILARWIRHLEKNTLIWKFNCMADSAYRQKYHEKNPTVESLRQPKQLSPAKRLWMGENPFRLIQHNDLVTKKPFYVWDILLAWSRRPGVNGFRTLSPSTINREQGLVSLKLSYEELSSSGYRPLRWQLEVLEEWGRYVEMRSDQNDEEEPDKEQFMFGHLTVYKRGLEQGEHEVYMEDVRKSSKRQGRVYVVVEILVVNRASTVPEEGPESSKTLTSNPTAVNASDTRDQEHEYVIAYKVQELSNAGGGMEM